MLHSPAKGLDLIENSDFTDANGGPTLDGWTKQTGSATVADVGIEGITSKYALQNVGSNM